MKQSEANKLLNDWLFIFIKSTSNMTEGIGGYGSSWDSLSQVEKNVLQYLHPALYPTGERPGIASVLDMMTQKDVAPVDVYNLAVLIERDAALQMVIAAAAIAFSCEPLDATKLRYIAMEHMIDGWEEENDGP